MDPYLIAILVIAGYLFLIYALKRTGFLERHNMSLFGPILMWRTQKGKEFIERLSRPRRLWTAYASIAKAMCVIVMILIMALLLWVATVVANIPPERAPGPEMLLGIPGINPIIPIWYGILGLIVAVVVHELAHGIMTRVGGMPLKSLGLVFMVIPLGAFVEPEESELVKTDKRRRTSVYAAGPAANVILAIVCALLFSSAFLVSVEPVRENPVVVSTIGDGPGAHAGIGFGAQIVRIDGHEILFRDDFENFSAPAPGANVTVEYYYAGELLGKEVVSGVTVTQTASGLPAAEAGIKPGMIIASVNDTIIRNDTDFKRAMALTLPYQKVNITLL
ncbi:MAG: PDZ domain-containing protein, partial [Euryarchaeota archaeon]|nr:PDZ domain-containing protein [Euryarchaeota archaeon]